MTRAVRASSKLAFSVFSSGTQSVEREYLSTGGREVSSCKPKFIPLRLAHNPPPPHPPTHPPSHYFHHTVREGWSVQASIKLPLSYSYLNV